MKRVSMQDVRKTDYYYEEAIKTLLTNIKFAGKDVKTIGIADLLYSTNYENLDIIFAGPSVPNPSALLGEGIFSTLMKKLREHYDYIFVDTPPLGTIIDAAIVAQKCDGAVLVVESEAVSHKVAKKVLVQIEKSGCRTLGAVLNKVDMKKDKYYSRYSGKYAAYYEKMKEDQNKN